VDLLEFCACGAKAQAPILLLQTAVFGGLIFKFRLGLCFRHRFNCEFSKPRSSAMAAFPPHARRMHSTLIFIYTYYTCLLLLPTAMRMNMSLIIVDLNHHHVS
jgi:hypothetical protein